MSAKHEALDQKIREQAFKLWQEAGSPEGREDEFWHRARAAELEHFPEGSDLVEDVSGHYPPISDSQNFA